MKVIFLFLFTSALFAQDLTPDFSHHFELVGTGYAGAAFCTSVLPKEVKFMGPVFYGSIDALYRSAEEGTPQAHEIVFDMTGIGLDVLVNLLTGGFK